MTLAGTTTSTAPSTSASLATLDHVTRRYGSVTALDDVSLTIEPGTILGLLGPNGAGKTTLISLLQGLRRATSGRVELFGGNPADPRSRQGLGSTPQETALPPTLRTSEVIDFVGAHFERRVPTAELAEEFGLETLLKRQTGSLSGGQKRRLSVALAFVGNPRLVLLDEPTTGLDVDARRTLWNALRRQHERGATVVVTSHYLEEIEALAERVVVMGNGRVLADDSLPAVLGRVGQRLVRLESPQIDRIAELDGVVRREAGEDGSETLVVQDSDDFITRLVHAGLPFRGLSVRGATLEEAFLSLTEPHGSAAPDASAAPDTNKETV
ncbi:ABC transporter ATP-binding protein [Compostimonas suwonensis]|uniref:ABC-2 type transport system ATP-binding protein n=1 Tax=Compostimonas suwonensis TaxID=1048394 RepID=A0A2M9BW11_9MICO|nr:ABC transporter ATP-binding protein [Compostimonas suwonensis]PJJ62104.1 ABC-2 type transport system ATP-binding protein [Compostimonas suwonensis]